MKFLVNQEQKMFASDADYQSMGAWIYYTAAILGACVGLMAFGDSAMRGNVTVSPTTIMAIAVLGLGLCSFAVADSVIRIDNGKTAAKKAVYNCCAIMVAMIVGAAAAIVVLVVVGVLVVVTLVSAILTGPSSGNGKKHFLKDENGNKIEVEMDGWGNAREKGFMGRTFHKNSDGSFSE